MFFDPMGQALCKRTLSIVEKLSEKCGDRLRFYLSKADEAGRETDRQVCVCVCVCVCMRACQTAAITNPILWGFSVTLNLFSINPS